MDPTVEMLEKTITQGFADLHRRLDDAKELQAERYRHNAELQTERHNTNLLNFGTLHTDVNALETKVDITNGTVSGHTAELKVIADRGRPVTLGSLRLYVAISIGSIAGIIWLFHQIGVIK